MKFSAILLAILVGACGSSMPAEPTSAEAAPPPLPEQAPPASAQVVATDVTTTGFLLAPIPESVTSFGAALSGSHLYVLGGYTGTPHEYSREHQSRSLVRLDLANGSWETLPPLETGLQGLALVPAGDTVIRVGGTEIRNAAGEPWDMHSVADVARLSPETLRWEPMTALPEARSSHDAVVLDGKVYVVGGWRQTGNAREASWPESMLVMDLSGEGGWREVATPWQRRALAAAAVPGKVIAIGGMQPDRAVSARVDVYDVASETWARGPDFPGQPFGVAATSIGDAVIASGSDGAVWRWRPGTDAWERLGALAFGRFFHRIVPAGDAIVVVGGISGMGAPARTRHVERFEIDGEERRIATFTMPSPGDAKNRQGLFLRGDTLYAFGGNNSVEQHDFEPENFLSDAYSVHVPSLTVTDVPDYPQRRQTMQTELAPDGGHGWSVGGFGHDGENAVTHPETYVFDFETGQWSERPGTLPAPRSQFGLALHGGHLWAFGGLDYDPTRGGEAAFGHVTTVLRAPIDDPAAPFREVRTEMPGPRRAFAAAVLEGKYYIVGGMRGGFELVPDCTVFDFERQRFSPMPCPPVPRLSGEMVALGGRLYLAGGSIRGEEGIEPAPRLLAYDPGTREWTAVFEEIPLPARHLRMMQYGDYLLLYSAHDDDEDVLRFALVEVASETR